MSINQIKKLSMNEHYYALLLQCFLSGYGSSCHIKKALMSLPILTYSESRERLKTAKTTSRVDTIFSEKQEIQYITPIWKKSNNNPFFGRQNNSSR